MIAAYRIIRSPASKALPLDLAHTIESIDHAGQQPDARHEHETRALDTLRTRANPAPGCDQGADQNRQHEQRQRRPAADCERPLRTGGERSAVALRSLPPVQPRVAPTARCPILGLRAGCDRLHRQLPHRYDVVRMSRRAALLAVLSLVCLVALPGSALAVTTPRQGTDPNANSPAGVIYSIPLDNARQNASPHNPGAGTTGGGESGGGHSGGGGGGTAGSGGSGSATSSSGSPSSGSSGTAGSGASQLGGWLERVRAERVEHLRWLRVEHPR